MSLELYQQVYGSIIDKDVTPLPSAGDSDFLKYPYSTLYDWISHGGIYSNLSAKYSNIPIHDIPVYPPANSTGTDESLLDGRTLENWWYFPHMEVAEEWSNDFPELDYKQYIQRSFIYGEYPFQPINEEWHGCWKKCFLGWVYDLNWPWVWSENYGWIYAYGFDPSNIWIYKSNIGFLWTTEDSFPWVYSNSESKWLYATNTADNGLRSSPSYLIDLGTAEIVFTIPRL